MRSSDIHVCKHIHAIYTIFINPFAACMFAYTFGGHIGESWGEMHDKGTG